jgi:hypothetical protein
MNGTIDSYPMNPRIAKLHVIVFAAERATAELMNVATGAPKRSCYIVNIAAPTSLALCARHCTASSARRKFDRAVK